MALMKVHIMFVASLHRWSRGLIRLQIIYSRGQFVFIAIIELIMMLEHKVTIVPEGPNLHAWYIII